MSSVLGGPIPAETDATCEDCAMCAGSTDRAEAAVLFSPETKCCTYMPAIPNFLVGRMLADDDPAFATGRATVEARLAARVAVSPLGLGPTAVHALLYDQGGEQVFGRSRALRCPHYLEDQGGRCGVWRHRNGVCATWFCKHVRGAVGLRFWQALERLLTTAEVQLGRWCMLELGLDEDALGELLPRTVHRHQPRALDAHQVDGAVDETAYRRRWGSWVGQERKWFGECARLVERLTWPDVVRIGGATVAVFERLTSEGYRRLVSDAIPERLKVGRLKVVRQARSHAQVVGYSGLDPIGLPKIVLDLLPYFDGGATAEILRRIRHDRGVVLEGALIRRLVDYEILVPPDTATAPLEQ